MTSGIRERDAVGSTVVLLGWFDEATGAELHTRIRRARSGDPGALSVILREVREAVRLAWPPIRHAVVVPVPGHEPGATPQLVMAAAAEIAVVRGWRLVHDALRRVATVPEAKAGGPRDVRSEFATLRWRPPRVGDAVILVDDVIRSGSTLQGCRDALLLQGERRPVLAMALAAVGHAAPRPSVDRTIA